ncbi:MAG: hypothetical protein LBO66_14710, partial [Deltaproteobacteria bacterium]|nr:hypothetical protein [Deltaproteobacteria bacterium]
MTILLVALGSLFRAKVCRAAIQNPFGTPGRSSQGKDEFQKYLIRTEEKSLFKYLAAKRESTKGATPINVELTAPTVAIRRPDYVFRMGDGSLWVIEFQSTARNLDIVRFLEYATLLASQYSNNKGLAPVKVTVVYAASVRGRPWQFYPSESLMGAKSLNFTLDQIFLKDQIDMTKLVRELNAEIDGHELGVGKFTLSERRRAEFFLAPLGKIPRDPMPLFKEYLDLAVKLAQMANDPKILAMAFYGVQAGGFALSAEASEK